VRQTSFLFIFQLSFVKTFVSSSIDPEGVVSLIAGGVSLRKKDLLFFFKPRRGDRISSVPAKQFQINILSGNPCAQRSPEGERRIVVEKAFFFKPKRPKKPNRGNLSFKWII
jgi:hypothetical protein